MADVDVPPGYEPREYPPFAVTVDLVVLTVQDDRLVVLLVERGERPLGLALPGGFVRPDEDLVDAARRELREEAGLSAPGHLEQLGTYGAPARDPRMRVVTVAYLVLAPDLPAPVAGTDARAARWVPVDSFGQGQRDTVPPLAFDHDEIVRDGVERARSKLEYTPLGAAFCPREFTVAELRRVYETVWGRTLDPRNFHRKVTGTAGFLTPTGRTTTRDGGRPAQLYRVGSLVTLYPPMLRQGA
ncbi:MAG: 8-oxo-dGTP diphosphatase [Frankiaceae bacterium]|jgi:8-oxo-dGTP diphosphatase|nr:8-oxo-dGTP diphosphatase [Frankiaceae bacterium]MDQ1633586.1 8-oxo-dGTP diphosphatase [Frankiaceae bacterium]